MAIKVCHVTSMHRPFDTRIFVKECGSLKKKYEVYLVASNIESQVKDGIHIVGVKMPEGGLKKKLTTKPIIKAAVEVDADLYHFHDPELMKAGLKLKKKGKKVIFDYHENFAEFLLTKDWIPRLLRRPASFVFTKMEKRLLSKYDALVSVTPFIVDRLKTYKKTYQITNYPISIDIPDQRQWGKFVSFVGGIVPQWMHHNIVDSLNNTSARYMLAGSFAPESYKEQLQSQDGWKLVDYYGRINYSDIFPFLQKSSAGLAIRTYNDPNVGYKKGSLGVNKFFEYMMAGIPIIASDCEVWREIIDKYECGIIVDPDNVDSIAGAINYLMENPEEAKKLGDNGHKAAKEQFNWATQEAILFEMYSSVLGK